MSLLLLLGGEGGGTQGGYMSLLAFWMGGAQAPTDVTVVFRPTLSLFGARAGARQMHRG